MNSTAKLEISVLATAFTLGMLGDALLRCHPWGVNFALWGVLVAGALYFLGRARPQVFGQSGTWLLLPLVLSPMAFLWHESPVLKALNIFCLLIAVSLAMLRTQGGRLRTSSLARYTLGTLLALFNTAFGMFSLVLGNREWNKSAGWSELRKTVALLLGLALAIPPLLVFGALFMGADPVFHSLVVRFLWAVPMHVLVTVFILYITGGYLRGLLFGKDRGLGTQPVRLAFSLGTIEMAVLLVLLDLLFLAFVTVEIRYFFGGSALVHATTGLTYSEYARRGFFQLLAVAALVLPFLLTVHLLLRRENTVTQRLFKWLAGTQIALLFVIMASAFQRMRLYQAEYGLSEQRLYPTAFMAWLAVVFVWFCITVLRGKRERFAFGAMVAGFLLIAVLHIMNPDALIARTNIERARAGRSFDACYLTDLSADAVPEIVAGLPALKPVDRCNLSKALREGWGKSAKSDWRSWTISRALARKAVSNHPEVENPARSEAKK